MRKYFLILGMIIFAYFAKAQDYDRSLGLRLGYYYGITYKKFVSDADAYEVMFTFKREGMQLTALRQFYHPVLLSFTDRFFFFYGYGGHLGYCSISYDPYYINGNKYYKEHSSTFLGIDGNIGVEYHFMALPVAVSFEYKPTYEYSFPDGFRQEPYDLSFTFLYTF